MNLLAVMFFVSIATVGVLYIVLNVTTNPIVRIVLIAVGMLLVFGITYEGSILLPEFLANPFKPSIPVKAK